MVLVSRNVPLLDRLGVSGSAPWYFASSAFTSSSGKRLCVGGFGGLVDCDSFEELLISVTQGLPG